MSNDFIEPWQKMMGEWQKTQTTINKQLVENMDQWKGTLDKGDNSFYSNNPVLDIYQSFIKKFFDHNPQSNLNASNNWEDILSTFPGSDILVKQMNELITGSKEVFEKLKDDFITSMPDDETKDFFLKSLDDISNPYSWVNFSNTDFEQGAKRFSEGPMFSGVSDIDNRVAKAMDSWLELGEKNNDYYEVLLKNWINAYEQFLDEVKNIDPEAPSTLTPRKLIELWSSIANDELMKMHRSDEFLQAQQQLVKASAQYRLQEQAIAEVICEALHIPTREEIDDLHKSITELKREVRALKSTPEPTPKKPRKTAKK